MREAAFNPNSPARPTEPAFSLIDRSIQNDPESIATELSYHCELLAGILGMQDPDEMTPHARTAAGDLALAVSRSIQDLMTLVRRANEADIRKRMNEMTAEAIVDLLAGVSPAMFMMLGQRDRRSPEKDQRMRAYYSGYDAAENRAGRVLGIDLTEPFPEAGSVAAPSASTVG